MGIVRNGLRPGQQVELTTLAHAPMCEVDMMSLLIIGNRATKTLGGRLVTPRGYPVGAS